MAVDKNIDPMLTASEVARLLNVHMNTVRRWSNQGVLKGDNRTTLSPLSTGHERLLHLFLSIRPFCPNRLFPIIHLCTALLLPGSS